MRLRTLLGDHPGTAALKNGSIKPDLISFDFVDFSPTNKGFKPMVREQIRWRRRPGLRSIEKLPVTAGV
jgi:hypothetical protein